MLAGVTALCLVQVPVAAAGPGLQEFESWTGDASYDGQAGPDAASASPSSPWMPAAGDGVTEVRQYQTPAPSHASAASPRGGSVAMPVPEPDGIALLVGGVFGLVAIMRPDRWRKLHSAV